MTATKAQYPRMKHLRRTGAKGRAGEVCRLYSQASFYPIDLP